MGSPVPPAPRGRDSGPVFSGVAAEIIEDTLMHLATENEQYLSELPEQAGCFKETRIVEFIFLLSEKWHLDQSTRYQAVELLERAKFLAVKEDCMLLAVGVISGGVFMLSPGHWEQVVEHLNCITGITPESILEFSYAVMSHVVGSTPEQHRGTKSPEGRTLPQK